MYDELIYKITTKIKSIKVHFIIEPILYNDQELLILLLLNGQSKF